MVYDANTASGEGDWDDPFKGGVTINGAATYKASFGGLRGFYGVNLIYSAKDAVDFTNFSGNTRYGSLFAAATGEGYAALKFRQFLFQDMEHQTKD